MWQTYLMEGKDTFITARPQSFFLQDYIAYYYFHSQPTGAAKRFIYYPHVRCGLTIYKHSNVSFREQASTTYPDRNIEYKLLYGGIEKHPWNVEIQTPFDKVGVAFQPLGINHFIQENLKNLICKDGKDFNYFLPDIKSTLDNVYQNEDIAKKVVLLDDFFHSRHTPFDQPILIRAVNILLENTTKYRVQDLSDELSVGRKTLYRLFKTHLNCSVKEYIDVVQFRKAVSEYQLAMKKPNFVNLALKSDYYDQSEFIRHFKKITGFNPKQFFKDLQHLGNEDTFWTFG